MGGSDPSSSVPSSATLTTPSRPRPFNDGAEVKYISSAPGTRRLTFPCPLVETAPPATTAAAVATTRSTRSESMPPTYARAGPSHDAEAGRQGGAAGERTQHVGRVRRPSGHLGSQRRRVDQRVLVEPRVDAGRGGDVEAVDDQLERARAEVLVEPHPAGDGGQQVAVVVRRELLAHACGQISDERRRIVTQRVAGPPAPLHDRGAVRLRDTRDREVVVRS